MDLKALTALTRHFDRDQVPLRRHRLAAVITTTVDGVPALLQVEYVADLHAAGDHDLEELDRAIADTVEEATRRAIATWRVADLPTVGDTADWILPDAVAGARVEHAVVTLSDVQVTPELRRLVEARGSEDP